MKLSKDVKRSIALSTLIIFTAVVYSVLFEKRKKKAFKVHIRKGNKVSGKLDMRRGNGLSAAKIKVRSGRKVKWLLKTSDVGSITNIYPKSGNLSVFQTGPKLIPGTLNWEGTVKETEEKIKEYYNIDWVDDEGNPQTYDPLIQVRPSTTS